MFKDFKQDRYFLAKYHVQSALIFLALDVLLGFRVPDFKSWLWCLPGVLLLTSTRITLVAAATAYGYIAAIALGYWQWSDLSWLLMAAVVSVTASAFIHNASHRSVRPKWLNRIVGEVSCLIQLTGFPDWTIIHVLHHQYSDDQNLDPHAPGQMSYWNFTASMRSQILNVFVRHFLIIHGSQEKTTEALKSFGSALKADHVLRVSFWFLLLGPKLFAVFFVPSVMIKMIVHSWVNWAAHRWTPEGPQIVNLKKGFIYHFVNFFGFGFYYHKNHHLSPGLFDPRTYVPTGVDEKAA